jgi:acyl carrier protein
VYVLDGHLQPAPIGVPGELYVGGDGLARGYLNQPELTAERFLRDPFAGDAGARMYRTGDRGRYRPDGVLEFLDRVDTQVKLRGYRIELGEIERLLEQHPAVTQAVVIVREESADDKRLVAYVIPADARAVLNPTTLRDALKKKLPAYMIPSVYVPMDRFPLTPNGKIDRKALPSPASALLPASRQRVPARTEAEGAIAAIWQDVLKVPEVGMHDNFFDLGGHSLLILQVHARIRETFDTQLSVAQMFQCPTVGALAERVRTPDTVPGSLRLGSALERGQRMRSLAAVRVQNPAGGPSQR